MLPGFSQLPETFKSQLLRLASLVKTFEKREHRLYEKDPEAYAEYIK